MIERHDSRYPTAPDRTSIAYQVVGDGPIDLVYAAGIWSNVDLMLASTSSGRWAVLSFAALAPRTRRRIR